MYSSQASAAHLPHPVIAYSWGVALTLVAYPVISYQKCKVRRKGKDTTQRKGAKSNTKGRGRRVVALLGAEAGTPERDKASRYPRCIKKLCVSAPLRPRLYF
jgi:hypothetical protein